MKLSELEAIRDTCRQMIARRKISAYSGSFETIINEIAALYRINDDELAVLRPSNHEAVSRHIGKARGHATAAATGKATTTLASVGMKVAFAAAKAGAKTAVATVAAHPVASAVGAVIGGTALWGSNALFSRAANRFNEDCYDRCRKRIEEQAPRSRKPSGAKKPLKKTKGKQPIVGVTAQKTRRGEETPPNQGARTTRTQPVSRKTIPKPISADQAKGNRA